MYHPYPGMCFEIAGKYSQVSSVLHSPPRSSCCDDVLMIEQQSRGLSDLLKACSPLSRLPPSAPQKPTSRVLTSSENLKALKENEKQKKEAAKLKEE